MTETPLIFANPGDSEEIARADLYGLLSRLWFGPPDAALMQQFARAAATGADSGSFLQTPWDQLVAAMRASSLDAARQEHEALFIGLGKPDVYLYASFYLSGYLNERPLVQLRDDLKTLGLARASAMTETEDHIAYEFEVMRYLIAGDDAAHCNLEQQRRFFRAHLQPWAERLCDAVAAHPQSSLYRAVAGLTRAFVQVETQAFDLME
jgi:TorA maturation chaperone TorD